MNYRGRSLSMLAAMAIACGASCVELPGDGRRRRSSPPPPRDVGPWSDVRFAVDGRELAARERADEAKAAAEEKRAQGGEASSGASIVKTDLVLIRFRDALRDVLGLAPIGGESIASNAERFYVAPFADPSGAAHDVSGRRKRKVST